MVNIDMIERGLARYLENELIPKLPRDGLKGFGIGVAATLAIRRSGDILRGMIDKPIVKTMGLVDDDGAIDIDTVLEAVAENVPPTGVLIDLPLGIQLRMNHADFKCIAEYIKGMR